MMKKKGYSKGGMKKKGYAKGGMPMNPDTGKPTFVGDGKGKMAGGGSAVSKTISKLLGESGKTLSDADRNLVKELIGDLRLLPFTGDNPQVIAAKLNEFRQKIIVKKRNEVLNAFRNLDGIARQDTSDLWGDSNWSEEDEAELFKNA